MKFKHFICLMVMVAFSCLIPSGFSKAATYHASNIRYDKAGSLSVLNSDIEGLQKVSNPTGFGACNDLTWYSDGTNYFQLVVAENGWYYVTNVCHVLNQNDYASTYEEASRHTEAIPSVGDVTISVNGTTIQYKTQVVSNRDYLRNLNSVLSLTVVDADSTFNTSKDFVAVKNMTGSYTEGDIYKHAGSNGTSYWYLVSQSYKSKKLFARCEITDINYDTMPQGTAHGDAYEMQVQSNGKTVLYVGYEQTTVNVTQDLTFSDKYGVRQIIIPRTAPMFLFTNDMNNFTMSAMDSTRYAFLNANIASKEWCNGQYNNLDNAVRTSQNTSQFLRYLVFEDKYANLVNGKPVYNIESQNFEKFGDSGVIVRFGFASFGDIINAAYVNLGTNGEANIPVFRNLAKGTIVKPEGNKLIFRYGDSVYASLEAAFKQGYQFAEWDTSKDLAANSVISEERLLKADEAQVYEFYPWYTFETDTTVDNISYHVENKTRTSMLGAGASGTVIAPLDGNSYAGDIEIPSTISYNNETVTINNIDKKAFTKSSITSIKLPETVNYLEENTFINLPTLKTVYVDSSVLRLANAFDKSVDLYTYYSYNAYKYYATDGYKGTVRAYSDVIKFHENDGTIDTSDLAQFIAKQDGEYVYFYKSRYTLPVPVKENCLFVGWFENPEFEGNPLRTISSNTKYTLEDGCLHLYAKWQVIKQSVDKAENVPGIDYDSLSHTNDTDVEKEAEKQEIEETAAQISISQKEARELADKQAQKKAASDALQTQEKAKAEATNQNESLEAYTSPIVKIRSVKSKSKKITVKFNCTVKANGYDVEVSTSAKFKKKQTKTLNTKANTGVFKKLKKGKKYYVRVRGYILDDDLSKIYGEWSDVKTVKVK